MNFKIIHETRYRFSADVFLEPHYLRLYPKKTSYGTLEKFDLEIFPKPAGLSRFTNEENELIHFCWFSGLTKTLLIRSESIISVKDYNPFGFILYPDDFNRLPFQYSKVASRLLLTFLNSMKLSDELVHYGQAICEKSGYETIPFITALTNQIHNDFIVEYREEGAPHDPSDTFGYKRGACRDLAWMQINLLRSMGMATRFVSGYYYFEMESSDYELHGWLEVFLPGAGWIGLDPSHGVVTGNAHIPVVAGSQFENTMPVSGTIRGDATSHLVTNVKIKMLV